MVLQNSIQHNSKIDYEPEMKALRNVVLCDLFYSLLHIFHLIDNWCMSIWKKKASKKLTNMNETNSSSVICPKQNQTLILLENTVAEQWERNSPLAIVEDFNLDTLTSQWDISSLFQFITCFQEVRSISVHSSHFVSNTFWFFLKLWVSIENRRCYKYQKRIL